MTCPDYIENFAKACEREGVSLFLLAGEPGTVDKAITKLKQIAPNLIVQGHHGYFEKSGSENEYVIEQINEFKPDILYVGFGMPLQEQWIKANFEKIETKVFLPLGACLDFYTNTVYRGPRWMTNIGLVIKITYRTTTFMETLYSWQSFVLLSSFTRTTLKTIKKALPTIVTILIKVQTCTLIHFKDRESCFCKHHQLQI